MSNDICGCEEAQLCCAGADPTKPEEEGPPWKAYCKGVSGLAACDAAGTQCGDDVFEAMGQCMGKCAEDPSGCEQDGAQAEVDQVTHPNREEDDIARIAQRRALVIIIPFVVDIILPISLAGPRAKMRDQGQGAQNRGGGGRGLQVMRGGGCGVAAAGLRARDGISVRVRGCTPGTARARTSSRGSSAFRPALWGVFRISGGGRSGGRRRECGRRAGGIRAPPNAK